MAVVAVHKEWTEASFEIWIRLSLKHLGDSGYTYSQGGISVLETTLYHCNEFFPLTDVKIILFIKIW